MLSAQATHINVTVTFPYQAIQIVMFFRVVQLLRVLKCKKKLYDGSRLDKFLRAESKMG